MVSNLLDQKFDSQAELILTVQTSVCWAAVNVHNGPEVIDKALSEVTLIKNSEWGGKK